MKEIIVKMEFKLDKRVLMGIVESEENIWRRIYEAVESEVLGKEIEGEERRREQEIIGYEEIANQRPGYVI